MKRLFFKKSYLFLIVIFILFPIVIINIDFTFKNINKPYYPNVLHLSDEPPSFNCTLLPDINYDSLNAMWYDSKIEMLIITPDRTDFINAVKPLMEWKNEKGIKTIILSNFSLYNGVDNAEKIRNMIKSYYEKENIQWVLLAGDANDDLIPIREVFNPDTKRWGDGRTETIPGEYYKPTDFYYSDLTGTWDSDGDKNWGESPKDNAFGLDEISWIPEVYVGRLPADNAVELEIMINKTLKYETNPQIGDWMNRMLLAGGVSSYVPQEYESRLTSYIIENYAKSQMNYTHLVEEKGNLTKSNLDYYFDMGYSTVIMAGHGIPTAYYRNPSTAGYTSSEASTSSNSYMPSLVYLDACSTSSYDDFDYSYNDNSIGEVLIKQINSGAIGAIGGLRVTWYFDGDINLEKLNRGNAKLFWKEFFQEKKYQQGKALYDSKVSYINSDYYKKELGIEGPEIYDFERKNILTYCLLGDPELDIYTNKPVQVLNPFTEDIYEGQLVSLVIKDINNNTIPNARVHFNTKNGIYYTIYADINGIIKFRVPTQLNQDINVTITGHNLIPSHFNFSINSDIIKPEIGNSITHTPKNPSTSDKNCFNIEVYDNQSGIESVFLLLSQNNFNDFNYFQLSNGWNNDDHIFSFNIGMLKPGKYSYLFVFRDFANNTNISYNNAFKFSIVKPITDYILIISIILTFGIIAISTFLVYKEIQTQSRLFEKLRST